MCVSASAHVCGRFLVNVFFFFESNGNRKQQTSSITSTKCRELFEFGVKMSFKAKNKFVF